MTSRKFVKSQNTGRCKCNPSACGRQCCKARWKVSVVVLMMFSSLFVYLSLSCQLSIAFGAPRCQQNISF